MRSGRLIYLLYGLSVGGMAPMGAVAQSPSIVDVMQEPSHHLVMSNGYVKVLDVRVAPHSTTMVHRHVDDYLFITLGGAEITNSRIGADPVHMVLRNGAVNFAAGGFAHSATVNSDSTFRNLTIVLARPATHVVRCESACTRPVPCPMGMACASVKRVFASDQWTADSVTIPPRAELAGIAGPDHPAMVIGISSAWLTRGRPSAGDSLMRGGPGKFVWVPGAAPGGGPISIGNAGGEPARLVVLSFTGSSVAPR